MDLINDVTARVRRSAVEYILLAGLVVVVLALALALV